MKVQCLSSQIISTLPQDMIEKIIRLLPIRDAVRTSILSSKWRYYWASIPVLEFDDKLFIVSSNTTGNLARPLRADGQYTKYKFISAISQVLSLHRGPLLKFGLFIRELNLSYEIDRIIRRLSTINTLKSFVLVCFLGNQYRVPSWFFIFQQLEELQLQYCAFDSPLTFNGPSMLRSLCFFNVVITTEMLRHLLVNCPLLEKFILTGSQLNFSGGNKFTFVELFECLPSIVHLVISAFYIKYFALGGMPQKLSTLLVRLKIICLDVCFMEQDELSSLLCLIRSSPNLEKISIQMYDDKKLWGQQTSMNFLDLQDYPSCNLNHLGYLKIKGFSNLLPEREFVKLIMAKSPVLKKAQINLDSIVSVEMFRDLLRHPFPCASPSAKFIIKH